MNSLVCDFLLENLDFPQASGIADATPEHFQVDLWNDESIFRHDNKSRQIAYSWSCAANAIARAILHKKESIFISINQTESQEKIRYAKRIYSSIMLSGLPSLVRDNLEEIEFSNGVRISSYPAKAARGRSGADVYLDEFAHVPKDKEIYVGTLPVISKGGRILMGSSPLGASGTFWEIGEQKLKQYPGYRRKITPWWEIYAFCNDVRDARKAAPLLSTAERVHRYGKERLQAIFDNMAVDDFQTEYECKYLDESTAFITWQQIIDAQDTNLTCPVITSKEFIDPLVWDTFRELQKNRADGKIEEVFSLGIDIGRTRNATELCLLGLSDLSIYPMRLSLSLDGMKFDDQLTVIAELLRILPIVSCWVDETGIGKQIAEKLQDLYPDKVEPKTFSNASKNLWSNALKIAFEQVKIRLPVDRQWSYQIHSIKKLLTATKLLQYDTDSHEKHHADRYWALALALSAGMTSNVFDLGVLSEFFRG